MLPDSFTKPHSLLLIFFCSIANFLFAATLHAQDAITQGDSSLRDRDVPVDVPNISGVWQVRGYNRYIKPLDDSDPPWLGWNKQAFEERAAAEAAGAPLYDPTAACLPSGIPRIIAAPYPVEIIQTPETTVFLYETQHLFRIVYMNQEHPADIEPSYMGHAVGWWEDETLVIDSVGFVEHTQIDEGGTLHTDQLHVVERLRTLADGSLEVLFTIDDPGAFTESWTARRVWEWRPDIRFFEYVCEENNRNAPDGNGVLRNF